MTGGSTTSGGPGGGGSKQIIIKDFVPVSTAMSFEVIVEEGDHSLGSVQLISGSVHELNLPHSHRSSEEANSAAAARHGGQLLRSSMQGLDESQGAQDDSA